MDYEPLRLALDAAFSQAAEGKGQSRHARNNDFLQQPILTITREVGYGFPAGQAIKKLTEAAKMIEVGAVDAARRELLGAIVYAAAAYIYLEERQ